MRKPMFDWDTAMRLYQQGVTDEEIAKVLGCTRGAVSYWRNTRNLRPILKPGQMSPEQCEQVAELLRQGHSCPEIEKSTGVFRETVRKFGRRNGIPIPPTKRRLPDKAQGIIDKSGYILLRVEVDGPYGNLIRGQRCDRNRGYALLHRMRMQDKLGRKLLSSEVVHHVDGDKYNNSLDNLQLYRSNGEHLQETLAGKVPNWTPEGRERILEGCRKTKNQYCPQPEAHQDASTPDESKTDAPA